VVYNRLLLEYKGKKKKYMATVNDKFNKKFANALKWIGVTDLSKENLIKLQGNVEREVNKRSGHDADFLDAVGMLFRISMARASLSYAQSNLDIVDSYLKTVSPVHIDEFRLAS